MSVQGTMVWKFKMCTVMACLGWILIWSYFHAVLFKVLTKDWKVIDGNLPIFLLQLSPHHGAVGWGRGSRPYGQRIDIFCGGCGLPSRFCWWLLYYSASLYSLLSVSDLAMEGIWNLHDTVHCLLVWHLEEVVPYVGPLPFGLWKSVHARYVDFMVAGEAFVSFSVLRLIVIFVVMVSVSVIMVMMGGGDDFNLSMSTVAVDPSLADDSSPSPFL